MEPFTITLAIEECGNGNVAIQIAMPSGQFTPRQIEYGVRIQELLKRELPVIGRALGGKSAVMVPTPPGGRQLNGAPPPGGIITP